MRELRVRRLRSCNDRVFRAVCRRFALYAVIVEGAADGSPAGSGESSARPRILLVEDDPTIREMTRLALERDGFVVETAGDGQAASTLSSAAARPGAARRDAAGHGRCQRVPQDPRAQRRSDRDAVPPHRSRSTSCSASRRAPTTTSPSRSSRRSCRPACGPSCAAIARLADGARSARRRARDRPRRAWTCTSRASPARADADRVPAAARAGRDRGIV